MSKSDNSGKILINFKNNRQIFPLEIYKQFIHDCLVDATPIGYRHINSNFSKFTNHNGITSESVYAGFKNKKLYIPIRISSHKKNVYNNINPSGCYDFKELSAEISNVLLSPKQSLALRNRHFLALQFISSVTNHECTLCYKKEFDIHNKIPSLLVINSQGLIVLEVTHSLFIRTIQSLFRFFLVSKSSYYDFFKLNLSHMGINLLKDYNKSKEEQPNLTISNLHLLSFKEIVLLLSAR